MFPASIDKHRWAVVLAGGDGTRLKELSQRISGDSRPKQFCEFFGGKSLLDHTRERIAPIFHQDRTLFVLARAHEAFYQEQLAGVPEWRNVVQPANRGTAVAMALCLQTIVERDEDALVAFFPSDHHYLDSSAFRETVERGLCLMEEYPDSILVVGAEARYAEVEYGWIQPGRTLVDSVASPLRRVACFWEKPSCKRAKVLQRRGCLWNTFITIGLAGTFQELLHSAAPELMRLLEGNSTPGRLDEVYDQIAPVDFSRSVLTPMPERLLVLRDEASGWTDFGSPGRVVDTLSQLGIQPPWIGPGRQDSAFPSGLNAVGM
jgi:mannose-1-phosphate guanylyltransferase